MRKENIIFGGEISGHYYCKKNSFCESPFFVLFTVLKEISETKKPLSKLISPFKLYYHSGEINFKVKDSKKVIDSLERDYEEGQIIHLDGLRIDFKDWWFCVRPSNTEPLLRMVLEAKTKKKMEEKVKELSLKIGEKY
jgi:phosphomannomutase